jgi:hypothetical protein
VLNSIKEVGWLELIEFIGPLAGHLWKTQNDDILLTKIFRKAITSDF